MKKNLLVSLVALGIGCLVLAAKKPVLPRLEEKIKQCNNPTKQETRLLLIRHGQTAWNTEHRMQGHADIALNDQGREQARTIAHQLHAMGHPIKAVYASDLKRAVDTAQAICSTHCQTVCSFPELREIHVGNAQGLTPEERECAYGAWRKDLETLYPTPACRWNHPEWPAGESKNQLLDRVTTCLKGIAEKHKGSEVAIVTHAGVIYTLVEHLTQKNYDIPNCSVTHIVYDHSNSKSPFTFEKINHLEGTQGNCQKTAQPQL